MSSSVSIKRFFMVPNRSRKDNNKCLPSKVFFTKPGSKLMWFGRRISIRHPDPSARFSRYITRQCYDPIYGIWLIITTFTKAVHTV